MRVNNKTLTRWKRYYEQGDKKKLEEYVGVSRPVITNAFRGEASIGTMKKIDEFYNARQAKLKELKLA